MYIENVPKSEAERYVQLLKELEPNCIIRIVDEDVNLCRFGYVDEIPCRLEVGLSFSRAKELYDQITQMEADTYFEDDHICYAPCHKQSPKEKKIKQFQEENLKRYKRYACLEVFLFDLMNQL